MSLILGSCSYQLVAGIVSGLMWTLSHRHESHSRQQVPLATTMHACIYKLSLHCCSEPWVT